MESASVERVLLAADLIPAGQVATYGDLARLAGVGPRQVGAIMAREGGQVAWWRVVNASGRLPDHLLARAQAHWDAEGIPHRDGRIALMRARVDQAALAASYWADVPAWARNPNADSPLAMHNAPDLDRRAEGPRGAAVPQCPAGSAAGQRLATRRVHPSCGPEAGSTDRRDAGTPG